MHLAPVGNTVRICCVYNFQISVHWQCALYRTALACFSWRRRQPVLQVIEYTCGLFINRCEVTLCVQTFHLQQVSVLHWWSTGKKSHPPTARGGVAQSNIQTSSLHSSLFLFAPYAPQWLVAIGVCPFSLVPTYLLYVLPVIVRWTCLVK